ncbi:MAG: hypothetical protein Q4D25_05335 [Bacteroidales bacterium]|jgi:DnaJ-class molecular chaperone|nr:hypothetical protein [Bacteroidaceae bacterium]MDO4201529.1 hypothetical protein [Bacteroidales bacterium]
MKKIILTLMLAVVSLSSFAQFGGGQFQMPKPEEMATRRADQVKEQVKDAGQLTDDQYKKVYDLYLKQSKDMQAKMNEGGGGFGAFNMEDMQKQQEATNKALKEILSEEQFKAYQKAQEEMMKRFQQGGGFGG